MQSENGLVYMHMQAWVWGMEIHSSITYNVLDKPEVKIANSKV